MKQRFWLFFLVLAICLGGSVLAEEVNTPSSENDTAIFTEHLDQPAPITAWNRTIGFFRVTSEGSSPAERAQRAVDRIAALPVQPNYKVVTSTVTVEGKKAAIISTKFGILFALLPGDVEPGKAIETEGQAVAERLQTLLNEHAAQLRWSRLGWSIGLSLLATAIYVLIIWALLRGKKAVLPKLEGWISQWQRYLTVAGIDLVPILLFLVQAVVKIAILAICLACTYIWLTYCFSRFFITQPLADQLGDYLIEFLGSVFGGIVRAAPGLFTVFVIFWLTRVAATGVSRFFAGIEKGKIAVAWLQPESARASRRIVVAGMWLFSLTIAYPYIPGSGSEAFKGISVFAGLMLSLGATSFINHIMSGLVIAYSGAMALGDYVQIGDIEGTVKELGPMSTKIATLKKEYMTIPNGVAIGRHITNYSRLAGKDGAIVSTTVTIGYDTPWRQVHALLFQASRQTDGIRTSPEPLVLQRALSDFYVEYELRVAIDLPEKRVPILSTLHAAIQDGFNEAGVQIMSPHFVSQPEDAIVVPKDQWYAPPADPEKKEVQKD